MDTSDILKIVFDRIPIELFDENHRTKMLDSIDGFPKVQHGIIEMYNLPRSERVDLMLCIRKKYGEDKLVAPYFLESNEIDLQNFIKNWSNSNLLLSSVLENIYLVYDLINLSSEIKPWPYLAFSKLHLDPKILLSIFKASIKALKGNLNEYVEDELLNLLNCAHSRYHLFGFGMQQGRLNGGFRIGISGFKTIQEITSYLEEINWKIDYKKYYSKLLFLDNYVQGYVLSLVIEDTHSEALGLECVLSKKHNKQSVNAILNRLEVDKTDEIIESVGNKNSVHSWINHIKVNYQKDNIVAIKTYLYYELT